MTLLRIDASIQGPRSASSALADLVQSEYSAVHRDESVVSRHRDRSRDRLAVDQYAVAVEDDHRCSQTPVLARPHAIRTPVTESLRQA